MRRNYNMIIMLIVSILTLNFITMFSYISLGQDCDNANKNSYLHLFDVKVDECLTREKIATIFFYMEKMSYVNENYLIKFKDSESINDKKVVNSVVYNAIMYGNDNKEFMPKKYMTRAEFIVALSRCLKISESYQDIREEEKLISKKIIDGHWADKEVNILLENNTVKGDEWGNLQLDKDITMAEVITMLNRAYHYEVDYEEYKSMEEKYRKIIHSNIKPNHWAYKEIVIAQMGT